MKKYFITISVLSSLILGSCFLFGPTGQDGSRDHNSMLETLGINTNLGTALDPDGNPVWGGYNPLGRKVSVFHKLDEIYVSGITFAVSNYPELVIDDAKGGYSTLIYTPSSDNTTKDTGCWFKSEAGDVDGDGREEVVFVRYNSNDNKLSLRTVDDKSGGYAASSFTEIATVDPPGWEPYNEHCGLDLSTGDTDGDSRDEIAVICYGELYILDDAGQGFKILMHKTYPTSGLTGQPVVRVAVGEIDGDGREDIVVVEGINDKSGGCFYYVYSGADYTKVQVPEERLYPTIDGTAREFEYADVAIGDYDGDRLNEIAFSGDCAESGHFRTFIVDDFRHDYAWLTISGPIPIQWAIYFPPITKTLDIDNDHKDEILATRYILGIDDSGDLVQRDLGVMELTADAYRNAVTVGDVNGDYKDDVITVEPNEPAIYIQGYNGSSWENLKKFSITNAPFPTICAANLDDDSPVVRYTGEHELLFTDPKVIAVLACPPYHGDSGQNIASCGTTFGQSSGTEVEETRSTGFSVGYSVGYEYADPVGITEGSFKATVETSMDWISSNSLAIEKSIAYSSGPDEDKVIFTAIPFDVYYYEVLSSPTAADVGDRVCISIPREMQTLSVARPFYNDNNGDNTDIDANVLSHSIGGISTYPTPEDKDTLIGGGGLESVGASVGIGSGSITLTVSMAESQGNGAEFDFNWTVEAEAGVGGFTVGSSAGFRHGFGYSVTNTLNTFYEGTVGDIPVADYTEDMAYQFGLFTYPREYGEQKFTVVDYWVK